MGADGLVGVADRDRNLDGRIEDLASVRKRLVRVAPYVQLLRRAADVDRDRIERELCIGRGFRGVSLPGRGRLGGIRCFGCGVDLRRSFGFNGVELGGGFGGLGSGLGPLFLGAGLGLVRLGLVECLFGVSEIGVGSRTSVLRPFAAPPWRKPPRALLSRPTSSSRRPLWRPRLPRERASRRAPEQQRRPPRSAPAALREKTRRELRRSGKLSRASRSASCRTASAQSRMASARSRARRHTPAVGRHASPSRSK